ncbi:unnamed protein product [Miscanthus lutarioriparius]|uniref:BPM/SPOP BACK domain-containing protein n=1 Tax=Miscanthus lutarioriparius TaxID=422564 RepID=A0A811R407_9POAL|nr:unnamed protein product [Miscanthus lutarioriparius]
MSASVFDSCSFTHQFKLNFLETKKVAIGHSVSSEDIFAGGHLWRIYCYPRGVRTEENVKVVHEDRLEVPPLDMGTHLGLLLDCAEGSDVSFIVDDLWHNMSVDTVAATLSCDETYNCPQLKKNCTDFIAGEKNFKKFVLTDGFVQLAQQFPSILDELREKVGA